MIKEEIRTIRQEPMEKDQGDLQKMLRNSIYEIFSYQNTEISRQALRVYWKKDVRKLPTVHIKKQRSGKCESLNNMKGE